MLEGQYSADSIEESVVLLIEYVAVDTQCLVSALLDLFMYFR
jgi:hypothetical protein